MTSSPSLSVKRKDLDWLLDALEVNVVRLADCLISPGYQLSFDALDAPAIHHTLAGHGLLVVGNLEPIELSPNTLVVVPIGVPFKFEVAGESATQPALATTTTLKLHEFHRFVAGSGPPHLHLICGYFRAQYGLDIDPFANLTSVFVERFNDHQLPATLLREAMAELASDNPGSKTMTGLLLKQLLITLFRRSLTSSEDWASQFSALGDTRIARAFSEMLRHPGTQHTIASLAQHAALSRSAFQARFTALFGIAPMSALRQLRMKRAATLLKAGTLSVEQVGREVGYASRSSFIRAYQQFHGSNPSPGLLH
jgi:AraC-like DNA-binding protein/mannose-6-phosphate isomerase-like protein (cupin superfamily)